MVLAELLSHGLLMAQASHLPDSLPRNHSWFHAHGVLHLDGEADPSCALAFVEEVDPN